MFSVLTDRPNVMGFPDWAQQLLCIMLNNEISSWFSNRAQIRDKKHLCCYKALTSVNLSPAFLFAKGLPLHPTYISEEKMNHQGFPAGDFLVNLLCHFVTTAVMLPFEKWRSSLWTFLDLTVCLIA